MKIVVSRSRVHRRHRRRVVNALSVLALTAFITNPAGGQIPDAPPLGFEIDPIEGMVGDTVDGQVAAEDIAEHCITDPVEFVAQFVDPEAPLGGGTAYFDAIETWAEGLEDPDDLEPATYLSFMIAAFFPIGLALDLNAEEPEGLAEGAMAGTFIMAFADLETQSPIAPYGNFDKNTGVGSTPVPDLPGGTHPVIATCVGLPDEISPDDIARAIAAGAAYVEQNVAEPYPDNPFDPEFAEVAGAVAPVMLEELIEPKGLGIAFYCVDDGEGSCDEEQPTDPIDPADPADPADPSDPGAAPGATPVRGRPSYTG